MVVKRILMMKRACHCDAVFLRPASVHALGFGDKHDARTPIHHNPHDFFYLTADAFKEYSPKQMMHGRTALL